jgi:hypothetical protein
MAAQQDIDLCFDTVYINKMPFLTSVSKWILYQTINWLPAQTIVAYDNGLDEVVQVYKQEG